MDTRRSMDSTVSILPVGNPPLSFADVSLGILIRAVPGGLLFRGTWNGEAVSVKVGFSAFCPMCRGQPLERSAAGHASAPACLDTLSQQPIGAEGLPRLLPLLCPACLGLCSFSQPCTLPLSA